MRGSDNLLVGIGRALHLVDVDWGKPGQPAVIKKDVTLVEVEAKMPGNRFNDGKADKEGRMWIGKARAGRELLPSSRAAWLVHRANLADILLASANCRHDG